MDVSCRALRLSRVDRQSRKTESIHVIRSVGAVILCQGNLKKIVNDTSESQLSHWKTSVIETQMVLIKLCGANGKSEKQGHHNIMS